MPENTALSLPLFSLPQSPQPPGPSLGIRRWFSPAVGAGTGGRWPHSCRVSDQVASNPGACHSKRRARRGHRLHFRIQHPRRAPPPLHRELIHIEGPSGLACPSRQVSVLSSCPSQVLGPVLTPLNSDSLSPLPLSSHWSSCRTCRRGGGHPPVPRSPVCSST